MGDFPNHQVFSKDIAESIGLEEAIIFETIKSQEIKRISIKELIKFLSYIPETKIIRCLQKLKKLNFSSTFKFPLPSTSTIIVSGSSSTKKFPPGPC